MMSGLINAHHILIGQLVENLARWKWLVRNSTLGKWYDKTNYTDRLLVCVLLEMGVIINVYVLS